MDHVTVQPPTSGEQARRRSEVAENMLRSMNEDWEYMSPGERRNEVRQVIRVLEDE